MKVSIISPVYNSEKFLVEMIESVIAQTYSDWELIFIDDCSTDGSVALIENHLKNEPRLRLIKLKQNIGAASARNLGIRSASGRFIAFLDSDDMWLPHKLERQITFMQKHNHPFSFTSYYRIDAEGNELIQVGVPSKITYQDLLKTCYIGCLTVVYDTAFFGKREMPEIKIAHDYALWLQLIKEVKEFCGLSEPLAKYRVHSCSISAKKIEVAKYNWYIYRNLEKQSVVKSSYHFGHYAFKGFLRSKFPRIAKKMGAL